MKAINSHSTIQVTVYEATLHPLVTLKRFPDEPLADVIELLAHPYSQKNNKLVLQAQEEKKKAPISHCKHQVQFLDAKIGANSYGELYGMLVDLLDDIAPEAVEKLVGVKARTRRYVAKDRNNIHRGRPDLPTLETKSGWYVSKNIGKTDFIRGVQALCKASDIMYGEDVRFPLKRPCTE